MGGRGGASGNTAVYPSIAMEDLPYNVTSFDDRLGGAIYPFLEATGRAWRILTQPVGEVAEPHPHHTFGQPDETRPPTLRWVNGDKVSDLYVDGLSTQQFLAASGLKLDMHKGGFVLSKRLSRVMRPHFVSGFFEPKDVTIGYMSQASEEAMVWDGAGLISRQMLQKMMLTEDLSAAKREQLERELHHAQRVEFTIMTPKGQDKGHAIVADNLRDDAGNPVDFILPEDTKNEVRLENGRTFVGLSFVHGHNDMRLDIQSLINLHPFFQEDQLLGWLKEEGNLFVQSVETGRVTEVMGRIDRHTTLEEVQAWPLREYLASGGHPMWFRSHVKSLMNQHLNRLNHSTLEKMRLPIPGGRHYIMPAAVGKRAGLKGLNVPRGYIHIDDRRGTVWVNDEDWLALPDSPKQQGIASILGGADNDDALWLHPFTDFDGEEKVLAWRSPNQAGEYVVLKPTVDSQSLPWTTEITPEGEKEATVYPFADSRELPPRIDFTNPEYLGLVVPETAGGLSQVGNYSVEAMTTAIERAIANQGALGMYCNALMLNKALYGRLPETPPAPLEDVIDSAVKTGADLSQVLLWNYTNSREILESRMPIPAILHKRLSIDWTARDNLPPLPRIDDKTPHWLDRLQQGVLSHIQEMQLRRDQLAANAKPPQPIFDLVIKDPDAVKLGAGLNKAFGVALSIGDGERTARLERAKLAVKNYLDHFPSERRGAILLGALASFYGKVQKGADTAVWLGMPENDAETGALGHQTIEALRSIRVLDDILVTKEGIVVYPADLSAII